MKPYRYKKKTLVNLSITKGEENLKHKSSKGKDWWIWSHIQKYFTLQMKSKALSSQCSNVPFCINVLVFRSILCDISITPPGQGFYSISLVCNFQSFVFTLKVNIVYYDIAGGFLAFYTAFDKMFSSFVFNYFVVIFNISIF
jgi:hypothetical protein